MLSYATRTRLLKRTLEQRFEQELRQAATERPALAWQQHPFVSFVIAEAAGSQRILDAGCGNGELTLALAEVMPASSFLGVELANNALEAAKKNLLRSPELAGRIRWQEANLERLLTEAGPVEAIIASHLLEDLAEPAEIFSDLAACLAPGGRFLILIDLRRTPLGEGFAGSPQEQWQSFLERFLSVQTIRRDESRELLMVAARPLGRPRIALALHLQHSAAPDPVYLECLGARYENIFVFNQNHLALPALPENFKVFAPAVPGACSQNDEQAFTQLLLPARPDWLVTLQDDEYLEPGLEAAMQRVLPRLHPAITQLTFDTYYLWESAAQVRWDLPILRTQRYPRVFRVAGMPTSALRYAGPQLNSLLWQAPGLHPRLGRLSVAPWLILSEQWANAKQRTACLEVLDKRGFELTRVELAELFSQSADPVCLALPDRSNALGWAGVELPDYYHYARPEILSEIPAAAASVLDLGCAAGALGQALKQNRPCWLTGIELHPEAARMAAGVYEEVLAGDLERMLSQLAGRRFDCIVAADVLEHLVDPWGVLARLRDLLAPEGVLICSIPNIRNFGIIHGLIHGHWTYQEAGILDRTHLRFFTRLEFESALRHAGLVPAKIGAVRDPALRNLTAPAVGAKATLQFKGWQFTNLSREEFDELSAVQFVFTSRLTSAQTPLAATPKPQPEARPADPLLTLLLPLNSHAQLTQRCLEHILRYTPETARFHTALVDNATTDATRDLLGALEGDITVLRSACPERRSLLWNQAAGASRGEYLLLLHPGVMLLEGWLDGLLEMMQSDPQAGAVAPRILWDDGRLHNAGGILYANGRTELAGTWQSLEKTSLAQALEVDFLPLFCLLIKRELFQRLQGLDTGYLTDEAAAADLGLKIRRAGFRCLLQPRAMAVLAQPDIEPGAAAVEHDVEQLTRIWPDELRSQPAPSQSSSVWEAFADRRIRQQTAPGLPTSARASDFCVVVKRIPRFDQSMEQLRLFRIIKILRELGHAVTLLTAEPPAPTRHFQVLEKLRVSCRMVPQNTPEWSGLLEAHPAAVILFFDSGLARQAAEALNHARSRGHAFLDLPYLALEPGPAENKKIAPAWMAWLGKRDALLVRSQSQRAAFASRWPDAPLFTLPAFHPYHARIAALPRRPRLLVLGDFRQPQGKAALQYFLEQIFPKVKLRAAQVQVVVAGPNPPQVVHTLEDAGIVYSPETQPGRLYRHAGIAVFSGMGRASHASRILDAIGYGLAVVATPQAALGLDLKAPTEIWIGDTAKDLAEGICTLLENPAERERIIAAGRRALEKNYSLPALREALQTLLEWLPTHRPAAALAPQASPALEPGLVSIIMLTHNQLPYTRICLESIFRHTSTPYELILVDNASSDGTIEFLAELQAQYQSHRLSPSCQGVRVILNPTNRGFALGNNQGLAVAAGQYFLLLNNDVAVTPLWLETMLAALASRPDAGFIGPMSNAVSGPQRFPEVGYDQESLAGLEAFAERFRSAFQDQALPFWRVVGFCMLMKRSVVEKIGGLDERFGLGNFEDDDFSLRAAAAGFTSLIAKAAFVHHFGSRTFRGAKIDYRASIEKNWVIFKSKWGLPEDLALGSPCNLRPLMEQGFKPEYFFPLPVPSGAASSAEVGL